MLPNLREQCEIAVGADPGADPDEMASAAIAVGGRIRRRRRYLTGAGVAAGLVVVIGLAAVLNPGSPEEDTTGPQMTLVAAADCSPRPVEADATDVVILPGDRDGHITGTMLTELQTALETDTRVRTVVFESREQAHEKFAKLWAHNPEFVASVGVDAMVPSFRLRLRDSAQYAGFRADYSARGDVGTLEGRICRADAPVGGVQ